MSMNDRVSFVTLFVVVCLTTLFIRIPLAGAGYFNFGDVAVILSGLLISFRKLQRGWLFSLIICGGGSAVADIIGGYAVFAPLTFVAKGMEGYLAYLAGGRSSGLAKYGLLVVGGACMVTAYFFGEWVMPAYGLQAAIREIVPNMIQAAGGLVGGVLLAHIIGSISFEQRDAA